MNDQSDQTPKKPGGVKHDSRGNAVWQWAAESGRHAIDSTSRLLKRLEVPGLAIAEDKPKPGQKPASQGMAGQDRQQAKPVSPAAAPERALPPDPAKGYDPYGGRLDSGGATKRPAQRPAAAAPTKPAATTGDRPSLLGRLFRKR
jgi:hypothetical protein